MCLFKYVCVYVLHSVCVYRVEDDLQESIFSLHPVGSRNEIQVLSLSARDPSLPKRFKKIFILILIINLDI